VPLLFLALALPIPLSFTERIHLELRHVVTAGTAAIVPWFGIPVFVEGTTLNTAHGALEGGRRVQRVLDPLRRCRGGDAHGIPGGLAGAPRARAPRRGAHRDRLQHRCASACWSR
jgi:hypothetical protein